MGAVVPSALQAEKLRLGNCEVPCPRMAARKGLTWLRLWEYKNREDKTPDFKEAPWLAEGMDGWMDRWTDRQIESHIQRHREKQQREAA